MLLNPEAIAAYLQQLGILEAIDVEILDETTSTNTQLWAWLDNNLITKKQLPKVMIAAQQTAGKGQWGKVWRSPLGGLYLSLMMAIELDPQDAYQLTIMTVWGIVAQLTSANIPVQIKWPNDLLLDFRKLGGIKTETRITQGKIHQAVIGVGINHHNPVPETGINLEQFWTDQPNIKSFELNYLAALVITGILKAGDRYQKEGINPILSDYIKCLKNLGEKVAIAGQVGEIVGVTPQGFLSVKLTSSGASTIIHLPPGQISLGYDRNQ